MGAYIHKFLGIELNGLTWNLLEKENRSPEDEYRLINAAHASLYHWSEIGEPVNIQRGEWLISHAYAVIGMADFAIFHAEKCMEITRENDIGDFDLAFAYEALTRAYAAKSNRDKYNEFLKLAEVAGNKIVEEEDIQIFMETLRSCKFE